MVGIQVMCPVFFCMIVFVGDSTSSSPSHNPTSPGRLKQESRGKRKRTTTMTTMTSPVRTQTELSFSRNLQSQSPRSQDFTPTSTPNADASHYATSAHVQLQSLCPRLIPNDDQCLLRLAEIEYIVGGFHITKMFVRESQWNPDNETEAQQQGKVCRARCSGEENVLSLDSMKLCFHSHRDNMYSCARCYPCDCRPSCSIEGTCCSLEGDVWHPPATHRSICTSAPFGAVRFERSILLVVECHPEFPAGESRDLCGRIETLPNRRRDTVRPVTSNTTKVTYANRYCAACNHDQAGAIEWQFYCTHNQHFYAAASDLEYDDLAVGRPYMCGVRLPQDQQAEKSVRQDQPSVSDQSLVYHLHSCDESLLQRRIIDTCNVTGKWRRASQHDQRVQQACENPDWQGTSDGAIVNFQPYGTYVNIFCAICNGAQLYVISSIISYNAALGETRHATAEPPIVRVVTTLITGYKTVVIYQVSTATDSCSLAHWAHPRGDCRPLTCTAGKKWTVNNTCITAVDRVRGLGYRMKLRLLPVHITFNGVQHQNIYQDCSSYADILKAAMTTVLDKDCVDFAVNITTFWRSAETLFKNYEMSFSHNDNGKMDENNQCFLQELKARVDELMQTLDIEVGNQSVFSLYGDSLKRLGRFLHAEIEMDLVTSSDVSRDDVEERLLQRVATTDWLVEIDMWDLFLRADIVNVDQGDVDATREESSWDKNKETDDFPYQSPDSANSPRGLEHLFLPLSQLLLCPLVSFNNSEFQITEEAHGGINVVFPHYLHGNLTPVTFSEREFPSPKGDWGLSDDGQQLLMCVGLYQAVFPANVTIMRKVEAGASLTHQIASLVCGSVSVLCLALTLLTYALFPPLRSLPGLNNMGLSGSLAAAQLSLLLPWHRAAGPTTCRLLGVLTHWLWLAALGWMAVCCTHMARVFTAKTRQGVTERSARRAFLHNVLLTTLVPGVVVALTVGVASGVSGGRSMGYGGSLCFLDTARYPLLILSFLLPLSLVLITDLVCFLVTVVSIARVRRLQPVHRDGDGGQQQGSRLSEVLVYVKLVTMTGGAWVLGLGAEALDSEWLRVLAEVCTAAQGVLLFLAYVCNARVWRMYRDLFGGRRRQQASAATATTTSNQTTSTLLSKTPGTVPEHI